MLVDPAIIARRHAALVHRVASRYLNADLLHNPREMPDIGDRVVDMEFGDDGWIQILFENGETLSLATGIHLGEARDSDTRAWQDAQKQELAAEGKLPDWSKLADRYLARKRAARLAREYLTRR